MPTLPTWSGRSSFEYTGSVREGTTITYGKGYISRMPSAHYSALLRHFRGRTVSIGTSRTDPPAGSLGQWLASNVTPTAIASYVGPILIAEGYAEKAGRSEIRVPTA